MVERDPSSGNRRNKRLGLVAAGAAVLALVGGARLLVLARDAAADESLIVAGVPGQVEAHDSSYTQKIVPPPPVSEYRYWLGIEQCPADITAAENGRMTQSFDPAVGVRDLECNFDWVRVTPETYGTAAIGEIIVFGGSVGESLEK